MRCIGIDWGEKRIGLSYGDEIGVATPMAAITVNAREARLDELTALLKVKGVTDVVIGYPYNMNGSVGFKAKEVDAFVDQLLTRIDLPVHRIDERLTSHQIKQHLSPRRDDELRRSGRIDSASATLILQDFLDQRIQLPEYDAEENPWEG